LDEIGINEISLKKGHKDFVTIVTARTGDKIIILAVPKCRKKSTVKAFLSSIPKQTIKENNPGSVFRPVRRLYQCGEGGFRE